MIVFSGEVSDTAKTLGDQRPDAKRDFCFTRSNVGAVVFAHPQPPAQPCFARRRFWSQAKVTAKTVITTMAPAKMA